MKKIKVKQIASSVRRQPYQRKNLIGLGLNKLHKTVELDDTPSIRGMINKVKITREYKSTSQTKYRKFGSQIPVISKITNSNIPQRK